MFQFVREQSNFENPLRDHFIPHPSIKQIKKKKKPIINSIEFGGNEKRFRKKKKIKVLKVLTNRTT